MPVDFSGIAGGIRGLELARLLWVTWGLADVRASGKGNSRFLGPEAMKIVYID